MNPNKVFYFMTYQEQLQDPRWKERRKEIIDKYWGYCFKCGTSKNLQVHHKEYVDGWMAWEYPDWYLIPLCSDCHALEHDKVPFTKPIKTIKDVMLEWIKVLQSY